jgi:hypothetical protein
MSEDSEDVTSDTLALIHRALKAVRGQNLSAVSDELTAAISICEQHPTQAHAPTRRHRCFGPFDRRRWSRALSCIREIHRRGDCPRSKTRENVIDQAGLTHP